MSGRGAATGGPRSPASRARLASLIDLGVAVLAVVVLWPFPSLRMMLPWSAHAAAFAVALFAGAVLYAGSTLALAGRTLGMNIADIAPEGGRKVGAAAAWRWAFAWAAAAVPSIFTSAAVDPVAGWPVRLSGLALVPTNGGPTSSGRRKRSDARE